MYIYGFGAQRLAWYYSSWAKAACGLGMKEIGVVGI